MSLVRPEAWKRIGSEACGVAVLGATGSVGQRFVQLLGDHPWFSLQAVCASAGKRGQPYGQAAHWYLPTPQSAQAAALELQTWQDLDPTRTPLVFSALPTKAAQEVEPELAKRGFWVVSNAAAYRMHPQVPLVVPEINADHLELVREQEGPGAIIAGPNCSSAGLVLALAPLQRRFGLRAVMVTTLQAQSGAGLPGVLGPLAEGNVLPHIPGEEDKLESEPLKILGSYASGGIQPVEFAISATCNRVAVVDGHTECVSVQLETPAALPDLVAAWEQFPRLALPSAPESPVCLVRGEQAPNPREHALLTGGMSTLVGRVRPCAVLDWKFTLLSHNTLRGAAGGALLIGEALVSHRFGE